MIKDDSFQSGKVLFLQAVIIQVFKGTKQKPSQNQLFNSASSAPTPGRGSRASESKVGAVQYSQGSRITPLLPTSHSVIRSSPVTQPQVGGIQWSPPEQLAGPATGVAAPGLGPGLASWSPRRACPQAWMHLPLTPGRSPSWCDKARIFTPSTPVCIL